MPPATSSPALSSVADLLERSQRLEVEALAQVHDLFYPEVYRYIRFRLEDDRLVEDVTSDVFLVFLEALTRPEGPQGDLRGWLLNTAASLVNDSLRRNPGKQKPSAQAEPAPPPGEGAEDGRADTGDPSKRELQRAVRQALAKLPVDQQHLLAVRFAEGRSLEDSAAAASLDLETLKLQQFRALDALRRRLGEV